MLCFFFSRSLNKGNISLCTRSLLRSFAIDHTLCASVKVKGFTGCRTFTCAREPLEPFQLNRGPHEPQLACPVDVLVRGPTNGVDGTVAKIQPLTVKQCERARPWGSSRIKKAQEAGVGEAESGPVKRLLDGVHR